MLSSAACSTAPPRAPQLLDAPRDAGAPALGPDAAFRTYHDVEPCASNGTQPFLVLGAEHIGSTSLVDLLRSHPAVACAEDVFNPRSVRAQLLAYCARDTLALVEVHRSLLGLAGVGRE